ncbi:pregnancy-specific beta-1-glycoprotein 2-like isoform X2 [Lithobates pipiens]
MCPLRVILLCPLRVILLWTLLCPGTGKVQEIFTRPGSDLLIPIRIHLTLNPTDSWRCDRIYWYYEEFPGDWEEIAVHWNCYLSDFRYFPNTRISENGSLIISNVTPENDGRYRVYIQNSTGHLMQRDDYFIHVEDPLSAPRLTVSCNNNGSANVSCVLEDNEDVSYHWTVNGTSLPRNHSRNITIINEEFISGPLNVSCSVNNSVSKKESNYTNIFCLAPPSTPKVIFSCQNNGSVSVSCVLEKEQNVTYNWTVNGKVYGDHSSNVTFSKERKTVPMNVSCSVQNSVSRKESNTTHISCPGQPCLSCLKKSLIAGSVALLLTMPPVFVAHWYILRGMRKKT